MSVTRQTNTTQHQVPSLAQLLTSDTPRHLISEALYNHMPEGYLALKISIKIFPPQKKSIYARNRYTDVETIFSSSEQGVASSDVHKQLLQRTVEHHTPNTNPSVAPRISVKISHDVLAAIEVKRRPPVCTISLKNVLKRMRVVSKPQLAVYGVKKDERNWKRVIQGSSFSRAASGAEVRRWLRRGARRRLG